MAMPGAEWHADKASQPASRGLLRRLHSASGLFPLGAYLVFHAWEHWPVRESRDALFERLAHTRSAPLEVVLVLLPLLVHAALGIRLRGEPDRDRLYASPRFRRFQLVTGFVAAAYLALHLVGAWLPRLIELNPIGAAFMSMRDQVGRLPGLALYVIGLAAVCTHFGQGLSVALLRIAPAALTPTAARGLGIAAGVLLWLIFLNELATYATAAPLL